MKLKQPNDFSNGTNKIVDITGPFRDYLMDFEILKLNAGDTYTNDQPLERAYLIIYGGIQVTFNGQTETMYRENYYDHNPVTLQLAPNTSVDITCTTDNTEIAIFKTENPDMTHNVLRRAEDTVVEERGKGFMNEAGTRITRTIIDKSIDPLSNLMLGEDMHYPGKWAGFPSHHHEQPEIYFYKFHPVNKKGFGLLKLGDDAVLLEENDTVLIPPNMDHPQVAAPGYAMYFIFAIRHLEGNPYIKPTFVEEHLWVEQPDAKLWPDH
ncbi:5-deoxy-glucuronate isomerase [Vallitalea okinawensis]|uniref:5-deoxy-glucuronate isomerase n=1 Tax=Vallitalea okinawensis TaxID=2078660 RepID=UPI000CFCDCA7|nr:5-deoxy-glucuronate isomerase [Vallitalea okinawensis]